MFKTVKCKGVLLREMNRHTSFMAATSFLLFTMPLIVICLSNPFDSTICRISGYLLLWYIISLFALKKDDVFKSETNKLFTFPVWISLKASVLIFKYFLKKKYPEIGEEHYERWRKLQRLKQRIKKF